MKKYMIAITLMVVYRLREPCYRDRAYGRGSQYLFARPNALTAEDKEIMRREQAEQDALEKAK